MNNDLRQGFIFGLNSGIITTAGLISGLVQAKVSKVIIMISVLSLALSDSISEAYGMFLSKKAEDVKDFSNAIKCFDAGNEIRRENITFSIDKEKIAIDKLPIIGIGCVFLLIFLNKKSNCNV